MEPPPGSPLDRWCRAHPGAQVCLAGGEWHAWLPSPWSPYIGAEAHAGDEDELLAKLDGAG